MQTLPHMSKFVLLCISSDLSDQGPSPVTAVAGYTFQCWQGNFMKIPRRELHSWKTPITLGGTPRASVPTVPDVVPWCPLQGPGGGRQHRHSARQGRAIAAAPPAAILCCAQTAIAFLTVRRARLRVWGRRQSLLFPLGEVYTAWSRNVRGRAKRPGDSKGHPRDAGARRFKPRSSKQVLLYITTNL